MKKSFFNYKTIPLTIPWGVSSVGNPRQPFTGFNSGKVSMAHLFNLHDIYCEVCKGLTKC